MMEADGVGMCSAGNTFFSSSLASATLFVFRKDPSAFANAHGSGPMGAQEHPSCSPSCILYVLLPAFSHQDYVTEQVIVCLKNQILCLLSTTIFVLALENVCKLCLVML